MVVGPYVRPIIIPTNDRFQELDITGYGLWTKGFSEKAVHSEGVYVLECGHLNA